ncbi:MAG: hypothetical protein KZQ77_17960 [Candidatus Thiodiazotropha sp. (ex Notomyrtea botanica)]|nr:hypothetical protein [Candidatus Thiodiazotropha sp. (ex Notomyrtea botanica)]
MGRLAVIVLALCWHLPAEAFFCINFSSHGAGDNRFDARRWMAFQAPPPIAYPAPLPSTRSEYETRLPSIKPEKRQPEIIQGYRFRPLEKTENHAPSLVIQMDRRR